MTCGYAKLIEKRAAVLRAAAERTENVEQLEAIVRDLEKCVAQAKRVLAGRATILNPKRNEI